MVSLEELRKAQAQKRRGKDFPLMTGYLIHRAISIHITRLLLTLFPNMRPNTVSWLMIATSIGGVVLVAQTDMPIALGGLVLIYIGFLLDKVDGEVARYRNEVTLRGGFLDELYHLLVPNLLLGAFFLPFLIAGGWIAVLTAGTIFLNVATRAVRKLSLVVFTKHRARIDAGEVRLPTVQVAPPVLLNSFLLKPASVIERFDIVLVSMVLVVIVETFLFFPVREYFFYLYALAAMVYTFRLIFLYCFGGLDNEAKRLYEKGY